MSAAPDSDYREALTVLQRRLDDHFLRLKRERAEAAPGTPVFALEHGLTDAELALVRSTVLTAVKRGDLPRDRGLPFVVYAAEVGYEYSGDEYWQTFADRTPGWWLLGDPARQYMRNQYRRFRDNYSGATPVGPWAKKFSIICWPITHAVLPTDLQRHLARLLYDFSRLLTAGLLSDPEALGQRLAAQAWQSSARLQAFAQNTNLLGQVATALLAGEDEDESPLLLPSTLTRIVDDLSKESETRRWLLDAKYRASKVRTHGLQRASFSRPELTRRAADRPVATNPTLSVREDSDGWSLFLELPDLVSLAGRLPEVGDEMAQLRPNVQGVQRRFGSGQLLYPGQQVRVQQWPAVDRPLIQLERGSELANRMLADHCVLSPGPSWLFRLRDKNAGVEVRGKIVRPGHRYLLVLPSPFADVPTWMTQAWMATNGVSGYLLAVPEELDDSTLSIIRQFGIAAVMDVELRPVGVVAAAWDGEGAAEWLEGEEALVAIRTSRAVSTCLLGLDDQPSVIKWPTDSNELLLRLNDMAPGRHGLSVSLMTEEGTPVAAGTLEFAIRPPQLSPTTGTPRQGLLLLPSPASPTLDEVWDGRAAVQILGPPGGKARLAVTLADRRGRALTQPRQITVALPIDAAEWLHTFATQFRGQSEIHKAYEQAETCVISASAPELGTLTLRCDRAFVPLRWAFRRDKDGPVLSLVDNTDGVQAALAAYDFARPCEAKNVDLPPGEQLRWPDGGLVVATAGSMRAASVMPPFVRHLDDLKAAEPQLPQLTKVSADVLHVVQFANLWGSAALPDDPIGAIRRNEVLQTFARALTWVLAGQRWVRAEEAYVGRENGSLRSLRDAIGVEIAYQQQLASALADAAPVLMQCDVSARVTAFANELAAHARPLGVDGVDRPYAEFLLRLISEPGTLADWPRESLEALIRRAFDAPLLVRAARFVVVTTLAAQDTGSAFAGWIWE